MICARRVLCAGLALFAAAPGAFAQDASEVAARAPEVAGALRLGTRQALQPAALGWQCRYFDTRRRYMDVYIYPNSEARGESADWLRREVEQFHETWPAAVRRGWYQSYRDPVDSTVSFATPRGERPGRYVRVTLEMNGQPHTSVFYIFEVQGVLVKVRVTRPAAEFDQAEVTAFVEALLRALDG